MSRYKDLQFNKLVHLTFNFTFMITVRISDSITRNTFYNDISTAYVGIKTTGPNNLKMSVYMS